jgi:hypothetical protein
LTDVDVDPDSFFRKNYASTLLANKSKVEATIRKEIQDCRYIVTESQPIVVSSIGAIPKPNLDVRLIHDLSRLLGGVNAYSTDNSVVYSTLTDATKLIKPGSFLAKIDLQKVYCSVPLSPKSYRLTGLHWTFEGQDSPTFMFDCRLPFGASKSCKISTTISNSISRMLARKGYRCINYIDDFLVVADSESECRAGLSCLLKLVMSLGLDVNWTKVEGPASTLTFLGIGGNEGFSL